MRHLPNSEQATGSGASPSITWTVTRCWFSLRVRNVWLHLDRQRRVARDHHVVDFLAALRVDGDDAQPVRVDVLLLDRGEHFADFLGQVAGFAAVFRFEDGGMDGGALGDRRVGRQPGVGLAPGHPRSIRGTCGISVEPPTSTTASSCSAVTPACSRTSSVVSAVRCSRSAVIVSNCSRVIVTVSALPS